MNPVVLDPGHGGGWAAGRSTPLGIVGPGRTREKDLTLDIALRVRRLAAVQGQPMTLTRETDRNLSLRERIAAGRALPAARFVSLHFSGSADATEQGCEAWVHAAAPAFTRELARTMVDRVATATGLVNRGVQAGEIAILHPAYHRADTSACLLGLSFLTDPVEEARLGGSDYRDRVAAALTSVLAAPSLPAVVAVSDWREEFDVWYEVPLVEQLTGMSCWAAAAAMLIGWRDCVAIDAAEVARGTGRWEAYRDGLEPSDVYALASAWGLSAEPIRTYTVAGLRELLESRGPLWVGAASPGLHVVVVTGAYGDGTPEGTSVRVADPWPVGRGERYTLAFADLALSLAAATTLSGLPAQVLHTGGGEGGPRRIGHRQRLVGTSSQA